MTAAELSALRELRLDWTHTLEDVWQRSPVHVDGLHANTTRGILEGIADTTEQTGANPLGIVIQGPAGSGKTHLLGWVREQAHRKGGYFVLVGPLSGTTFWPTVAGALVDNLVRDFESPDGQDDPDGQGSQLRVFLRRLCTVLGASDSVRAAVSGDVPLEPVHLKDFIVALRAFDRKLGRECQDTLRALVLYGFGDFEAEDIGHSYLQSMEEQTPGERDTRGMNPRPKPPVEIVRDVTRLLAITGPVILAIDQVDTVVAESMRSESNREERADTDVTGSRSHFDQLADGLLVLRDTTVRTLCVLSCLPTTWTLFQEQAVASVRDRFRELTPLGTIETPDIAKAIVAKRFAARFQRVGFAPPYPTWPVTKSAFADAPLYTPRGLLQRIDRHVQECVASGGPRELKRLADEGPTTDPTTDPTAGPRRKTTDSPQLPDTPPADPAVMAELDARFAQLRTMAVNADALNHDTEDSLVPPLLAAGLEAWIAERGAAGAQFHIDGKPSSKPQLHARLRQNIDERVGDEQQWCFRAVTSVHPPAALNRLCSAASAAAITPDSGRRQLFILRNSEWSSGAKTQNAVDNLLRSSGRILAYADDDLRTLSALRVLLDEAPDGLRAWLLARQPASRTALLKAALGAVVPREPDSVVLPPTAGAVAAGTVVAGTSVAGTSVAGTAAGAVPPAGSPADSAAFGIVVGDPDEKPTTPANGSHPNSGARPNSDASSGGSVAPPRPGRPKTAPTPARPVAKGPVAISWSGTGVSGSTVAPRTSGTSGTSGTAVPSGNSGATGKAPTSGGPRLTARAWRSPAGALGTRFTIGTTTDRGHAVQVELESLRRHTAIFAGSGSGKTVLIRRLVEECALRGVSSIVLDPNNDLARLGDAWPDPPSQWGDRDAELATTYLAGTEVVVWTPRRGAGRPLSFRPLPDFASVLGDPDEFDAAIDTAAVTLAGRANMAGTSSKASVGQAILRKALRHFALGNRTSLAAFLGLLSDLPHGVASALDPENKLSREMAKTLTAATVNDPLFGGRGEAVDPGVLLSPAPGKRARVSVISLIGLPGDEQRQSFVNQLQMALFAWAKKNPAGDRPLGGLFVMDEAQTFAPSGAMTACTRSTLALASQARKYGLGLVFATQAPKGLHNQIPGNATTQFFGRLNAPTQIDAAREMARVKGGDAPDIGKLRIGQFYAAGEGVSYRKLQTPLCLSHHPKSPLTTEEILNRARRKP